MWAMGVQDVHNKRPFDENEGGKEVLPHVKTELPLDAARLELLSDQIDEQLTRFESEIELCEQSMAAEEGRHRRSVDLEAWRESYRNRYEIVDDVSPSLIFFARCALGYLCSGAISEKELRLAVIDSCKKSEVRVNNRGGLSGSQVDLSIICGVLQTIGVLDEEKKSKQSRKSTPTVAYASYSDLGSMAAPSPSAAFSNRPMAAMSVDTEDMSPPRAVDQSVVSPVAASASRSVDFLGKPIGLALTVKTEFTESSFNLESKNIDSKGGMPTELRKGMNDALSALGELSPSYFQPTGGVDGFVLQRFRSRLSDFIAVLQAKIKQAAVAAEAAAQEAAVASDLSLSMEMHEGDADLSIGMGIDINMGLDLDANDDGGDMSGHAASVFEMEDDTLLFDSSVPLDTLAGTGDLDITMADLADMNQTHATMSAERPVESTMVSKTSIFQETTFEECNILHPIDATTLNSAQIKRSDPGMYEQASLSGQDTGAKDASGVGGLEEAPLAVLADLLSRKEGDLPESVPGYTGDPSLTVKIVVPPSTITVKSEHVDIASTTMTAPSGADIDKDSLGRKRTAPGDSTFDPEVEDVRHAGTSIRLPSYTEASLVARGYKKRKVEAMCISLRHVYNNSLFFKEELNGTPMTAASIFGCCSWENLSGGTDAAVASVSGDGPSESAEGPPIKPKRGRRPKIRLPFAVTAAGQFNGAEDAPTPVASTPVSAVSPAGECVPSKKAGPKNFNSNFGSRVWKMNRELDEIFADPPSVFVRWAESCYKVACAEELEEAALRQLGGMFHVKFPYNRQIVYGTSYLDPLPKMEPIARKLSKYDDDMDIDGLNEQSPEAIRIPMNSDSTFGPQTSPGASGTTPSSRRKISNASAPATLTAETLLTRFKRRSSSNYHTPVLSLRDNKTVQFKSPTKGKDIDSSELLSTEDIMIDCESVSFPAAVQPVIYHRKRSKSMCSLNIPSPAEITTRHQPPPLLLHDSREGPTAQSEMHMWEAISKNISASKKKLCAPEKLNNDESVDAAVPTAPLIYMPPTLPFVQNTPQGSRFPPLNSSCYHGRYISMPDLTLRTEPMHWMAMAAEFSLLGDTIVGEQSLLHSGSDLTPSGSIGRDAATTHKRESSCPDSMESDSDCQHEDEDVDDSEDEFTNMGSVSSETPDLSFVPTEDMDFESPSRRSNRHIRKSVSDVSLVSVNSTGSVISGIAGIADSFSRQPPGAGSTDKSPKSESVLKTTKSGEKKRKYSKLTINVPLTAQAKDDGPESGRYSTRKFAAVQSPHFREIKSVMATLPSPADKGADDATIAYSSSGSGLPIGDADNSSGEDTSDEAYMSRHDVVLSQMRERIQAIAALRKEQKEQRKKEKTGRFSSAVQNIAVHNTKRRVGRAGSLGSEGDEHLKRKKAGIVVQSHSVENLMVNSPRKRVPVNRDIESYVPPPRAPKREHSNHSKLPYDCERNPLMRKRGRPQKASAIS